MMLERINPRGKSAIFNTVGHHNVVRDIMTGMPDAPRRTLDTRTCGVPTAREPLIQIGRRCFLKRSVSGTALIITAAGASGSYVAADPPDPVLHVGLVTDLHFADKPTAGTRHYRETPAKLAAAARTFSDRKIEMLVELGDLIDAADSVETEQGYLDTINTQFSQISADRHYVLGNHCVDTLKKREFLDAVKQADSYYSFDRVGYHFIVLDACFRQDGVAYERKNFQWTDTNIPDTELDWLKSDLSKATAPTIVFIHQRLDVPNNHGVKNQIAVREVLEKSGQVEAVFQGHSHQNDLNVINEIPYCTLVAMVEGSGPDNNAYSLLELHKDGTLQLHGFQQQASRKL